MTFTLEELQHILGAMNGGWIDDGCEVCSSARKKLEVMIAELKSSPRKGDTYEKPVPEWMKDLGVSKIDVVIE